MSPEQRAELRAYAAQMIETAKAQGWADVAAHYANVVAELDAGAAEVQQPEHDPEETRRFPHPRKR